MSDITATAQASSAQVTASLKAEIAAAFKPALDLFFTNAEKQTTVGGVAAQAPALVANVIAAVPSTEGDLIKLALKTAKDAVDHAFAVQEASGTAAAAGAAAGADTTAGAKEGA